MKVVSFLLFSVWLSLSENAIGQPLDRNTTDELVDSDDNNSTVPAIISCPTDFVRLGNHCYYFEADTLNWFDALKDCQRLRATLAHPLNAQENSLIADYLRINNQGTSVWIGGTDDGTEGAWVWTHSGSPIVYNDWFKDEPNNARGREHCLMYNRKTNWKWNDDICNHLYGFMCQL